MNAYPRKKTKEEILAIIPSSVDEHVISQFDILPDKLEKNGLEYRLSLVITQISSEQINYEFNYYCKGMAKFLLDYKIFTTFEESIKYLMDGLNNG